MILIKFKKEWVSNTSDWDKDFNPEDYLWAIERGRWAKENDDLHNSWIDIFAVNAPHGEWTRIGRERVTLSDIINLYDDDANLSVLSDAYGYDENGKWVFKDDLKNNYGHK